MSAAALSIRTSPERPDSSLFRCTQEARLQGIWQNKHMTARLDRLSVAGKSSQQRQVE
jgi:hypothetical protein